jgi:hypothetical protein
LQIHISADTIPLLRRAGTYEAVTLTLGGAAAPLAAQEGLQ